MNAYFAYQVVGYHGTGDISYGTALAAVFVEGLIFIALSLLGMRTWLVRIMPSSLKEATAAGIGLFIAFIGLSNTGLGLVTANTATVPLDLAGCPTQYADPVTGACSSHKLQSPAVSKNEMRQLAYNSRVLSCGSAYFSVVFLQCGSWRSSSSMPSSPGSLLCRLSRGRKFTFLTDQCRTVP